MMNNSVKVLLDSVWYYFEEGHLYFYIYKGYWSVTFLWYLWFLNNVGLIKGLRNCGLLCCCLEKFEKYCHLFYFKCVLKYSVVIRKSRHSKSTDKKIFSMEKIICYKSEEGCTERDQSKVRSRGQKTLLCFIWEWMDKAK